jgi:hypothetical protein
LHPDQQRGGGDVAFLDGRAEIAECGDECEHGGQLNQHRHRAPQDDVQPCAADGQRRGERNGQGDQGAAQSQAGGGVAGADQLALAERREPDIAQRARDQEREGGQKMQQQDGQAAVQGLPKGGESFGHGELQRVA